MLGARGAAHRCDRYRSRRGERCMTRHQFGAVDARRAVSKGDHGQIGSDQNSIR